jgi:hypothetical protein
MRRNLTSTNFVISPLLVRSNDQIDHEVSCFVFIGTKAKIAPVSTPVWHG